LGLVLHPGAASGETILASKHDLSIAGRGAIKASTESEVCLFCHTPHRGTGELPLWNHAMSQAAYIPYSSSTVKATIGQPTGSSKLCLSCHDGTVALGMVHSRPVPIEMRNAVTTMPAGPANLGTDLSDDHPISFVYDSALATAHGQLRDPATLNNKVRLDHTGQMQCTSCHDPHDNQYGKFLVQDNYASALCLQCHNPNYWADSAHRLSNKTWNGTGLNPWPHSTNTTVRQRLRQLPCLPRRRTKPRLLNHALEKTNCLPVTTATWPLTTPARFNKFSAHPILDTSGSMTRRGCPHPPRHVECGLHNPHVLPPVVAQAPLPPAPWQVSKASLPRHRCRALTMEYSFASVASRQFESRAARVNRHSSNNTP
jgi:predicted CXXCH cytochrome family protein